MDRFHPNFTCNKCADIPLFNLLIVYWIASYAPQAGSFAVVPSSNRNIVNSSTGGIISSTVVQQSGSQPIPVRFNPQLIVDGNKESGYDGLLQKQLGHQQVCIAIK